MMLTYRPQRDIADKHKLVVALVVGESSQVERTRGEEFGVGAGHPRRGAPQALGVQFHAKRLEELPGGQLGRG